MPFSGQPWDRMRLGIEYKKWDAELNSGRHLSPCSRWPRTSVLSLTAYHHHILCWVICNGVDCEQVTKHSLSLNVSYLYISQPMYKLQRNIYSCSCTSCWHSTNYASVPTYPEKNKTLTDNLGAQEMPNTTKAQSTVMPVILIFSFF